MRTACYIVVCCGFLHVCGPDGAVNRYIKYLYPYECEMLQLSNADDLAAAIDGNKRDIIRLTPVSPTTSHRTLSGISVESVVR